MTRRRDFLATLAGLAVLAAAPWPAWAGGAEAGDAAWTRGELDAALRAWEEALATEADPIRKVELLLRIAGAHRERGELKKAGGRLGEAEATGLLPARVANDRGLWLLAAGDAAAAEAKLKGAVEAARTAGDPALAATAANNLGLVRMALGRPDDAGKAFEAARGLFATLGDAHGVGDALTNAGLAHRRAGRLREARTALEDAISRFDAAGERLGAVDARNDLGIVLQALGLDDAAAPLYERALADAADVRRKAALTANLATVAHRKGDLARAKELYGKAEAALQAAGRADEAVAIALQRALLGAPDPAEYRKLYDRAKDPRVRATAALNLAGLTWREAPADAAKLAAEARGLGGAAVGWRCDYLEGRLALQGGKRDAGVGLLKKAVDALEATRRTLSDAEAAAFRGEYAKVYEALVDASLSGGDTRGAAVAAERMALADHEAPPVPADAVSGELRALADRQSWLERQLATAPPEQADLLRSQLGEVQAEFAARVDQLRASYPHFAELVRTDPEDLEAVRRDLDEGVVVVQPVALPDKLVLLVYRRERITAREVPVTAEVLGKQVALVCKSLRAADTWDPEWTAKQCDALGAWLYTPVADELATAKFVVISATGVFRQLPFSLLRHDGKWLAERVAVANVTHVGSLRQRGKPFKVDGRGLLLVGNPDGTLPGAEAEVQAIARTYKAAKVLVGPEGKREAVLEACTGKSVVHLATHGLLDASFPEKSLIVLTGFPDPVGRLAYREIPTLGPWLDQTRMVLLSACESALPGDVVAGNGKPPMAVSGLAGQFRRAGVETLVASLWSVSDDATMGLMTTLYARLSAGDDVATALATAQRKLLADSALAHPFFWAPFIVVGDWR